MLTLKDTEIAVKLAEQHVNTSSAVMVLVQTPKTTSRWHSQLGWTTPRPKTMQTQIEAL
jgi:hypothetical protein